MDSISSWPGRGPAASKRTASTGSLLMSSCAPDLGQPVAPRERSTHAPTDARRARPPCPGLRGSPRGEGSGDGPPPGSGPNAATVASASSAARRRPSSSRMRARSHRASSAVAASSSAALVRPLFEDPAPCEWCSAPCLLLDASAVAALPPDDSPKGRASMSRSDGPEPTRGSPGAMAAPMRPDDVCWLLTRSMARCLGSTGGWAPPRAPGAAGPSPAPLTGIAAALRVSAIRPRCVALQSRPPVADAAGGRA